MFATFFIVLLQTSKKCSVWNECNEFNFKLLMSLWKAVMSVK